MNNSLLLLFVVLFAVILVFFEIKKKGKRKALRILASLLCLVSLYFFYQPFEIESSKKVVTPYLITETNLEAPDSLKRAEYIEIQKIEDVKSLFKNYHINEMLVLGKGLRSDELKEMKIPLKYIPSMIDQGIERLTIQQAFAEKESTISGRLTYSDTLTLHLNDGISALSQNIENSSTFSFKKTFKNPGKHELALVAMKGEDTVFNESLGVYVQPSAAIRMLLVTSSPSFESKFLIEYLKETGASIAIRQQISPDIYFKELINIDNYDFNNFDRGMIEDFDLLIVDSKTLEDLGRGSLNKIEDKIKNGALGLLLVDPNEDFSKFGMKGIQVNESSSIILEGSTQKHSLTTNGISISGPVNKILLQGAEIAVSKSIGLGKIGISRLPKTYPIKINGDDQLYAEIWKRTLEPIIGRPLSGSYFEHPDRIFQNQQTEIYNLGIEKNLMQIEQAWPSYENYSLPDYYSTRFWPKSTGWKELAPSEFSYIYPESSWKSIQQKKDSINTRYFESNQRLEENNSQFSIPVPRWIFLLAFILFSGVLWLEEKL